MLPPLRAFAALLFAAASLGASARVAASEREILETEGELGAGPAIATGDRRVLGGGDLRAGWYFPRRRAIPMLVGNRLGVDLHLRILYGRDAARNAMVGDFLFGIAPSFTHHFGTLGRNGTGFRAPSALGLVSPEIGAWLRTEGRPLFYLGWRAPFAWLPEIESGLEIVPAFAVAPAGPWRVTVSIGAFLR